MLVRVVVVMIDGVVVMMNRLGVMASFFVDDFMMVVRVIPRVVVRHGYTRAA